MKIRSSHHHPPQKQGRDPTPACCVPRQMPPPRAAPLRPFPGLWPDGRLRMAEPTERLRAARETRRILEVLVALNHTLLFTAFYHYQAHIGLLEIRIYEGRWNDTKKPVRRYELDCRHYPLREWESRSPYYARWFLEAMILLVQ